MSLLAPLVAAAEHEELAPLIFPAWVFPLIAVVAFAALALIVWTFRDVANRHADRIARGAAGSRGTEQH